jgi:hypothetical protein
MPSSVNGFKTCTKCQITKLVDEFSPRKEGIDKRCSICKKCNGLYAAERRRKDSLQCNKSTREARAKRVFENEAKIEVLYTPEVMNSLKQCTICESTKPRSDYGKDLGRVDGFVSECRECVRARANRVYWENHEEKVEYQRRYQRTNPDIYRKSSLGYYYRNRNECLDRNTRWIKDHPEYVAAQSAVSRAQRKNAMPAWANRKAIARIYREARRVTQETGVKHVVDHVIPLSGKYVCGLHVEGNLMVITHEENALKSNKFSDESLEDLLHSSGAAPCMYDTIT